METKNNIPTPTIEPLASKTREIAIYAATQFGQLFAELILF